MAFDSWKLLGVRDRDYPWQIKKFAGKVKEVASLLTGIPVEAWEMEQVKNGFLGDQWMVKTLYRETKVLTMDEGNKYPHIPFKGMTGREMLQKIGTDCMREHLHPDTWVNALFADYKRTTPHKYYPDGVGDYPNWIITDVRFPNEAKAIKDRGGVLIRVNRPDEVMIEEHSHLHPSETALDTYQDWDYVIENDGTIEELIEKVKEIYNEVQ